jgi:hypothetical protein
MVSETLTLWAEINEERIDRARRKG